MLNALRNPSFFRPTSRPSSPAAQPPSRPDSGLGFEPTRHHNKLSLTPFRRTSPGRAASSGASTPTPLIQDGSYLEALSLRLSEAVSKALAQPSGSGTPSEQISGRKPIPQGRGHALGALITSELQATRDNLHLYRAATRCLHRPLSVLVNNLSSQLLPLISSPAFVSAPAPSPQSPNLNAAQVHALAIASFASDLLETFDELHLGLECDPRGDGLKDIREGFVALVNRVMNPLLTSMKNELLPLLDALELPGPRPVKHAGRPALHPSIIAMQPLIQVYARVLARYAIAPPCQTLLATFLISIVWRGLVALSHRAHVPPSPAASPLIGPVSSKKLKGSPLATPPLTPPASRFTIKLPPSRPASPTAESLGDHTAADARALFELLANLPRPIVTKETELAREAVSDAYNGLKALGPFLDLVYANRLDLLQQADAVSQVDSLSAELPSLITLQILLNAFGSGSLAGAIGLAEDEYRRGCLSGFARAEECSLVVAERAYEILSRRGDVHPLVLQWLEIEMADTSD